MNDEISNIGNYKGLMLCSRPDQVEKRQPEREFISRVSPKDPLGYTPCPKPALEQPISRRSVNIALVKHRLWLEQLQKQVKEDNAKSCL
jgi:protein tyrosine phosphatase (PTP) superfamily phosphohydrolase (DUF442 family)